MKRLRKPHDQEKRALVNAALQAQRAGRRWLLVATLLALIGLVVVLPLSRRQPAPPDIPTAGLDPAVARVINEGLGRVRAEPKSGEAWGQLGATLMHYEFIKESAMAFGQAHLRAPNDAQWYYLHGLLLMNHEPNSALDLLRRSAERAPDTIDMPRVRLAQFLTERNLPKEAEMEFRRLLERDPRHAAACLGLARLLHQQGRGNESIPLLHAALPDPRTRKSANELLATVHWTLGQTNVAQAAARTAASLPTDTAWPDPYWDEAARTRVGLKNSLEQANALLDSGQAGQAVLLLQATTRDYPSDAEGWYLLGWAYNQRQEFVESERALQEHLRLSTNSAKGMAQLAVAVLGQRRFAEAIPILESARRLKPTWRELHANLGYACVQAGRLSDAEAHYRQALAQDPNHVASYTALGELLLRRGELTEGRQILQQAAKLAPEDPRVQSLLKKLP